MHQVDPRLFQIATLATLLAVGVAAFDLQAGLAQATVTIVSALAAEAAASRLRGKAFDWRSPMITGLSLTLLLRTADPVLWIAAAVLAIGSKSLLRVRGKHLFNPACFAIVALLLATREAWVSPGQWGALAWGAAAIASAAGLVLSTARRIDMAATFLAAWVTLLAARCVSLGDPWTIPLHQMQSGALLVFSFFMITDPRSTPNAPAGRLIFACLVAAIGHVLQFQWQLRAGLFYALILVSFTTPLLDILLPEQKFQWKPRLQPVLETI